MYSTLTVSRYGTLNNWKYSPYRCGYPAYIANQRRQYGYFCTIRAQLVHRRKLFQRYDKKHRQNRRPIHANRRLPVNHKCKETVIQRSCCFLLFLIFSALVANPKNYFTRWPIPLVEQYDCRSRQTWSSFTGKRTTQLTASAELKLVQ